MKLLNATSDQCHQKLEAFLKRWPLSAVKNLSLSEYSEVGNKDTFCYWLEFGSEELGVISGKPSNKFGIWNRKIDTPMTSVDFLYDEKYAWYKKYGGTPEKAFKTVRGLIVSIIENAQSGNFRNIDAIDLDSLAKWKIAFVYSSLLLLPIYKNEVVRKIAKHFEYPNYHKGRLSDLHNFIVAQKPKQEDLFEFASKYYKIATQKVERNYYIIGSKYEDENGGDTEDVFPYMLEKGAISTGFFWKYDFSHLVGYGYDVIHRWIDKNIPRTEPKFDTAKRTLGYFLNLKPGDIVAVKSHGRFGGLTIIAYAQVKEINGKIYEFGDDDLGHLIYVDFLETGLYIQTGLSYGQTIHQIVPGEREGHFEKIFGSYALTIEEEEEFTEETNEEEDFEDEMKEKNTSTYTRTSPATQIVTQVHNNIQNEFARYLKRIFPDETIKVERQRIDICRKNNSEIFFYEIKPHNSAYACIREGLGQLLDYSFSSSTTLNKRLVIVGVAEPLEHELKFIEFIKSSLNLNFNYEYFDMVNKMSQQF